jgi:ADP-ribose pyrophosphatase YjhB (NUDIX family)
MSTIGAIAIIMRKGRVFLVYRADLPVWELPGGAVEDGESVSDAVVREAAEETGLSVQIKRLVGVYSRPKWRRGGDHTLVFLCDSPDGEYLTKTNETVNAGFFDPNDLPHDLWPIDRICIADALEGEVAARVRTFDLAWPFGDEVGWHEGVQILNEYIEKFEALLRNPGEL